MKLKIHKSKGWKRDRPDHRDKILKYSLVKKLYKSVTLPNIVDLRYGRNLTVYTQGELGSCTANAIAGLYDYLGNKARSRLFIYYNERKLDNTIDSDEGSSMRTGIKVVSKYGACSEKICPYIIKKFTVEPTKLAYDDGLNSKIKIYQRITQTELDLRMSLAYRRPFVFGIITFENLDSDEVEKTGILSMPKPGEKETGGHALLCVGYNHSNKTFLIKNSWGPYWGQGGYFTLPYDYVLDNNLSDDFWTFTL